MSDDQGLGPTLKFFVEENLEIIKTLISFDGKIHIKALDAFERGQLDHFPSRVSNERKNFLHLRLLLFRCCSRKKIIKIAREGQKRHSGQTPDTKKKNKFFSAVIREFVCHQRFVDMSRNIELEKERNDELSREKFGKDETR